MLLLGAAAALHLVTHPGIHLRLAGHTFALPSAASEPPQTASAHEASQGYQLVAATGESVHAGSSCAPRAPVRQYDVAAIDVDITLNRYLDHDPQGRMYVLEQDLRRVRDEEAQNRLARTGQGQPAVSIGLQGDALQPLVLRVLPGECLRIRLRDALGGGQAATIHVHGTSLLVAGTGKPATAANHAAIARPGSPVTYEWMVGKNEPEGTHDFHSHGDTRQQTEHGLFGAVIVEPPGSTWSDPLTGKPAATGWAAIVKTPRGPSFREFVLTYHEIGDENYRVLNRSDQFVPQVDPTTGAYRPDARAINYRSEPFMNRLGLQQQTSGRFDDSLAYSSYAFGDPATPIMRTYLGDPVKQRLVHGGSETFHVHHVHGGSTRWHRQGGVEPSDFAAGLQKKPALRPQASERTDSQSIGPSETFDIADECGSGGCQQSAGDFMFHCHVGEHYFAGMWGLWRVYNTSQDGRASTDTMPPLRALPDRQEAVQPAVDSSALAGRTVDWYGKKFSIPKNDLASWVDPLLPPSGTPRGYDAAVLDWRREGDVYYGEPETETTWPAYRSDAPGSRPRLLFDARTGKLAYPFLRPHLGKRPPFAPAHGPAPFLDPIRSGTDPPAPGESGQGSVCPAGTRARQLAINAITVPVTLNRRTNLVDPGGEIFVLRQQEDAVRRDPGLRVPLVVRANAGEDCIDVLLRSELSDSPDQPPSKVSVHVHFVQFDVQGSDGVDAGFNYEQTVRPFRLEGESLSAPSASHDSSIQVGATDRFQPGEMVGVGIDQDQTFEVQRISSIVGKRINFVAPLTNPHGAGELVSTEFVRYRWFPDAQVGTTFFHDHTNVLESATHGLYGALVVEPPGSTYHDPATAKEIESGPVADIHTQGRISTDVSGSFRELVMLLQDDNPLTAIGRSTGSSMNLRVEPLQGRSSDPTQVFSSTAAGEPETPMLQAYVGDPLVFRSLVGAANDVHTWHLDGHWFRSEAYSSTSAPTSTAHLGISERQDLVVPSAGGPQQRPGDYLYENGRPFKLREGSWGILRVQGASVPDLRPLPGHETVARAAPLLCPGKAPVRRFQVSAVAVKLPMLKADTAGRVFVLRRDRDAVRSGAKTPEPLTLHVGVGDCVVIELSNETDSGPVSLHADMLAYDPNNSGGVAVGRDRLQAVDPGTTRTFTYYASPAVGETTAMLRDGAGPLKNVALGLYGAVIVGPSAADYVDASGRHTSGQAEGAAVAVYPHGAAPYRDFSLYMQDEDAGIGTHRMPYTTTVEGVVGLNYASEPIAPRLSRNADPALVFSSAVHGDPATPLLQAFAGEAVRMHVLMPWSEQAQVFSVEGHRWPLEPGRAGTPLISSLQVGGLEAVTLDLEGGAGGVERLPGDYVYGDHREPYREAGLWGVFRVYAPCDAAPLSALRAAAGCGRGEPSLALLLGVMLALAAAVGATLYYRRRREVPGPLLDRIC